MKKAVIGINCFGHDASCCIVDEYNGEILYAIAEERLSNIKHDSHFPIGALIKCQEYAKNNNYNLCNVALNFVSEEFISGTLKNELDVAVPECADMIFKLLLESLPDCIYYQYKKTRLSDLIDREFEKKNIADTNRQKAREKIFWYFNWAVKYKKIEHMVRDLLPNIKITCINHHTCHATSAYFSSGFKDATILVIDGQGESETISVFKANDSGINKISATNWPNSLGIFYLSVTQYLGYSLGDEFKVMGMSAYGKPEFKNIFENIFSIDESLKVVFNENEYFNLQPVPGCPGHEYYNFTELFKKIVPSPNNKQVFEQAHFDLAASVQYIIEKIGVQFAIAAIRRTGIKNLVVSGGVALNGLMNERIRQESGLDAIYIYPASGDDGTCVGAAQMVAYQINKISSKKISTSFLGGVYPKDEIEKMLQKRGIKYIECSNIHQQIAQAIVEKKIVARFHGRSEFGPRALGNRSILANPTDFKMKGILNERIKHREPFRPFAPACLKEYVNNFFELPCDSPFMLLIPKTKPKAHIDIPAVVHNDFTARVQTVCVEDNKNFYDTINAFYKLSGVPVLINTSFNVNGEAIVETPLDALESFGHMDIDYLAMENFWIAKDDILDLFPNQKDQDFLKERKNRYIIGIKHPLKNFDIGEFEFLNLNSQSHKLKVKTIISAVKKYSSKERF